MTEFLTTKQWARGLSTLARIYESADFQALTGLAMDSKGLVTKAVSDTDFKEMATIIVRGMLDGNINTRSLNSIKSPRYLQLMKELAVVKGEGEAGQASANGANGSDSQAQGADSRGDTMPASGNGRDSAEPAGPASRRETSSQSTGSTTTAPRGRKKRQRYLDLGQIQSPDSYPIALRLLLGELSDLDVQKYPNTTFLTLRAVLEKSIKSFAEAKTIDIKKSGNNANGRVQLRHCLDWLLGDVRASGPNYLVQVRESVRTGRLVAYTTTKDALDAANHNHHFKVDPDEAIAMWDSIDSIMRYLMKP